MHVEQHEYLTLENLFENEMIFNQFPYHSSLTFSPLLEEFKKNGLEKSALFRPISEIIEKIEAFDSQTTEYSEALDQLVNFLFSTHSNPQALGFIGIPFKPSMFYATPYTLEKFSPLKCKIRFVHEEFKRKEKYKVAFAAIHILNSFYNQNIEIRYNDILTTKTDKNILEHYQISINFNGVKVVAKKPIPELTEKQINYLVANPEDTETIVKTLPPEIFHFEGVALASFIDVTEVKVISDLKDNIVNSNSSEIPTESMLNVLKENIRSYMKMPEIQIGIFSTIDSTWRKNTFFMSLLSETTVQPDELFQKETIYNKIISEDNPILITDLDNLSKYCLGSKSLHKLGYRSLILAPLTSVDNSVIGVFEMASKKPMRFDTVGKNKLEEIYNLFSIGLSRALVDAENEINLTIQQHFTSLHPSVEWRFRNAASNFIDSVAQNKKQASIEPIVFKDVFPFYGQADIVNSSEIRNTSIKADLEETLVLLINTLSNCVDKVDFHLLNVYNNSAKKLKLGLEQKFSSNDETIVIEFLQESIHPLLNQLVKQFPIQLTKPITTYFDQIDPNLHVVYNKRKLYENSVHQLNQVLANFLEKDNKKLQQIIPHYFEYYKTDGIEYNLYVGQSIAPNALFSGQFLKNFRLSQLEHMVQITKKIEEIQPDLKISLYTAQLIFAYSSPLSIRFRMDEKQFDVDGAYNIRFELLKKRIDKSTIKGTNERLTQKGKIAIVYLQNKEREEYLEYINYLISSELIDSNIEELELSKVQGVDGLKALRVTVL